MPKQISFEEIRHEGCEHCPHNPEATKPYIKMKKIDFDKATIKCLEKFGKQIGLNPNCIVCASLHRLMEMPEEQIMKLLEASTKLPNL